MSQANDQFTRREFLYTGLGLISTLTTVPAFLAGTSAAFAETTMRLTSKPGVPEDRVLVVIQLSGGNDGLNTVVPYGMAEYYRARPRIGIAKQDVLSLDDKLGIGLPTELREIHDMVKSGLGTVVQGVGYPNPIRSHFASMDVWHSGDTTGKGQSGWIGRAFDKQKAQTGLDCVAIGSRAPLAVQGKAFAPVTFQQPDLFKWSGREIGGRMSAAYDALLSVPVANHGNDAASFVFRTACDAHVASEKVRAAVSKSPQTKFPSSRLGGQLKRVAAMIADELPTRVYYVATGGFDTHAGEADKHPKLMEDFSQSVSAFYKELAATGHSKRVVSMAFSEFGRRVAENASGGTDHGTAGPVFLFGDAIKPGLLGTHPSLTQLDHGDLIHTVDFRSIYADLIGHWMKMDPVAALGKPFRPTQLVKV